MHRELYLSCEKAKGGISFANGDDRRCEGHARRDAHNGLFRHISERECHYAHKASDLQTY